MKRSILMIVIVGLIGCDNANGGGKDDSTTPNVTNQVIKPGHKEHKETPHNSMFKYTNVDIVEMDLDEMPFSEAFRVQHRAKGEGHTFWWNGTEYTTDLYVSGGNYRWVRNSRDTDDSCRSNRYDECGVCNGTGMSTWYIDLDGDGLGDPATYRKDCTYPGVDEE